MGWGDGGYIDAKDIAKKMLAERQAINLRTKLTWNKDDEERLYSTHAMIGQVNLSAPYIKIGTYQYGKFYYIQNCQFYWGNGQPATLEEIKTYEEGVNSVYAPGVIDSLLKAEEVFLADAAKRDDALCKICIHYRSKNHEDYLRHIMSEHPAHAMKLAGIEPEGKVSEPAPSKVGIECCGRTFKDYRALGAHKRFSKENHGA
jgi:hypothetical protein